MSTEDLSANKYIRKSHIKINYIKLLYILAICLMVIFCFFAFVPLLNATIIAVIICCLAHPMLEFFERKQIHKMLAVLIVFLIIIAILILIAIGVKHLIPSDPKQAINNIQMKITNGYATLKTNIIDKLPDVLKKFFTDESVEKILNFFSSMFSIESIKNLFVDSSATTGNSSASLFTQIFGYSSNIMKLVSGMTNVFSIIFVALVILFFLMLKGRDIEKGILMIIPNKYFEMVVTTWREISQTFSNYLIGTLLESLVIGFLTAIGWYFCGVTIGAAIIGGFLVGLLNAIPYVGPLFGAIVGIVMTQFGLINTSHYLIKGFTPGIINMTSVIIIVQLADQVLKPMILSQSVNLPGLIVFLGIIAGGKLFGFLGMIFAVPIIAIFKIILTTFYRQLKGFKFLEDKIFSVETHYEKEE